MDSYERVFQARGNRLSALEGGTTMMNAGIWSKLNVHHSRKHVFCTGQGRGLRNPSPVCAAATSLYMKLTSYFFGNELKVLVLDAKPTSQVSFYL